MTNNYAGWSYSIRWFVPMLPLLLFFLFPYFETFNSRRRACTNVLLAFRSSSPVSERQSLERVGLQ